MKSELARLPEALTGSLREYRMIEGSDLLSRIDGFYRWQEIRRQEGLWSYGRSTENGPRTNARVADDSGLESSGVNFGSQDYLSLSDHQSIRQAAHVAIERYGVHSAGSAAFMGNTAHSIALEKKISEFLHMERVVLYPTGYAAGAGAIKGLVRSSDHIVMDALAHACLQDGAASATKNVYLFRHLDVQSARRWLSQIRAKDTTNGILVVTEGLFSMDSDSPDIAAMQELCREFNATLMVDVAHDLGCLGEDGTGQIGIQNMLGKVDIVMGSFSKTFASNGGFVACGSRSVQQYLRYFSTPGTFSNALSPIQAAVVLKAFEIVDSAEGLGLRQSLMANILALRKGVQEAGFEVYGAPSAIVAIKMGNEPIARLVARQLTRIGLVANMVEYPAVPKGAARFRLQVMAKHNAQQIQIAVACLQRGLADATEELEEILHPPQRAVA
jgi:7-keto-8-aminopelargonate synthetase-like enzyme